jgi:saccharopine dehydrogenase (NADP+, L-glutamate forming)
VVVSMLPADWHLPLARLCLKTGAHFVSSSYIAPEMAALHDAAVEAGVSLVNEVGLDPGIDHLMAHALVAEFKAAGSPDADQAVSFLSYCGGIPKTPNPFRYKFSWSPLGVLKALGSPSRSIGDFGEREAARPWDALATYPAPLPAPETFEVYPNRDSLPFLEQYRFDPDWRVRDFVRGTLRLEGWAEAWRPIFDEIEGGADADRLRALSQELWQEHAYGEDEADRVVLIVDLEARKEMKPVWHQSWVLDAWGDARGSAMARLVSVPVALAVRDAAEGRLPIGVTAAPEDPDIVARWLERIGREAQHIDRIDRLAV